MTHESQQTENFHSCYIQKDESITQTRIIRLDAVDMPPTIWRHTI